jgi:hypothetical protein
LAVASLSAQSLPAPAAVPKAGPAPRAADGHPDLTGVWSDATLTPFERSAEFAGKPTISDAKARDWVASDTHRFDLNRGGAYNVLFYDNGSGSSRKHAIEGGASALFPAITRAKPTTRAASSGNTPAVPMTPAAYNNNYQIVKSPDSILIVLEMVHDGRIIHMNAKHQPPTVRQWFGDSIGHWKGDTLVVETTNFTDHTLPRFLNGFEGYRALQTRERQDH